MREMVPGALSAVLVRMKGTKAVPLYSAAETLPYVGSTSLPNTSRPLLSSSSGDLACGSVSEAICTLRTALPGLRPCTAVQFAPSYFITYAAPAVDAPDTQKVFPFALPGVTD